MARNQDVQDFIVLDGPFASVALDSPSAVDDATDQFMLRWRNARRDLEEAEFPPGELDRMDETVAGLNHREGAALVLLHAPGAPSFVEHLDVAIRHPLAVVDSLPRIGPVLESRQLAVPHLMVVTDRAGADIVGFGDAEPVVVGVEGETLHLHKGHPGGWSQRRFQQRAENQWESNAHEVADEVANLARRLDARLITIAGDVRAVTFLMEHLPSDAAELAQILDGQSPDLIAEETVRAVATLVARDTRNLLEEFREEHGQGRAATGATATLVALAQGRVGTLLVHDDPGDERRARFERDGIWCAVGAPTATEPAPAVPTIEGRLIDVAIHSAMLGDADVRFVPEHGPTDEGLGALLRW